MIKTGQIVGGDFEILEMIGQGGMGFVFKARQRSLDRVVCLKVPKAEVRADPEAMRRFEREAKTIARLNHPNIVGIFLVHLPDSEEDDPYIVMEYVEGLNLEDHIYTNRSTMTIGDLLDLFLQICEGLEAAHEASIIHRDIKPANIVISAASHTVKIMDFGIARIQSGMDSTATRTMIVGTPAFMSPEQVRGEKPTASSDIYAFGAVLYVLFAQRPLFEGGATTVAFKQVTDVPPAVRESNRLIPAELDLLILRTLEKDPKKRPSTARALAENLDRVLRPIAAEPLRRLIPDPTAATEALLTAARGTTWHDPEIRKRTVRILGAAALAGLLLLLAGVGRMAWTERRTYYRAESMREAGEPHLALALYVDVLASPVPKWLPLVDRDDKARNAIVALTRGLSRETAWEVLQESWTHWKNERKKPQAERASPETVFAPALALAATWRRLAPTDAEGLAFAQTLEQRVGLARQMYRYDVAAARDDREEVTRIRANLLPLAKEDPELSVLLRKTGESGEIAGVTPTKDPIGTPEGPVSIPATPTPSPTPSPVPTESPSPTASPSPSPSPSPTPATDPQVAAELIKKLDAAVLQGPADSFFREHCTPPIAAKYQAFLQKLSAKYELREARHTMADFSVSTEERKGTWTGRFLLRGRQKANIAVADIGRVPIVHIQLEWKSDRWLIVDTDLPFDQIGE